MSESIVAKLLRGLAQIEQKHGALKPNAVEMNGDVLLQLSQNYIQTVGGRRFFRHPSNLTVVGLTIRLNDYLDPHTVLVTRKIGPPGDVENEVVGVIDLTPPAPKSSYNAERDTVINVAHTDGLTFTRLVIPREAIQAATLKRGEIFTGIRQISRGFFGPYKLVLTLDEVEHAVSADGKPCILNTHTFFDDPAPAKTAPAKTEPEVDESWIWLANL